MLYHLLAAPADATVWIEDLDDVGFSDAAGTHVVEQVTSSQDGNPISDGAEKTWKTIANWIEGAKAGWFDPAKSAFRLHVLQDRKPGKLVQRLIDARDGAEAGVCLEALEQKFWGAGPKFEKKSAISPVVGSHIEIILTNRDIAKTIISHFSVVTGEDLLEAILKTVAEKFFSPTGEVRRKHFCQASLGWLKVRIVEILKHNRLASIARQDFLEFTQSYARQHLRTGYLSSIASVPAADSAEKLVREEPTFVKQLGLIQWDHNDLLSAVNSYLMAKEDLHGWATDGEITSSQLGAYQDQLRSQWRLERNNLKHDNLNGIQFGSKLAAGCLSKNLDLDGNKVGAHITPGVYHDLADGDGASLDLGWHPDFEQLLAH